MLMCSQLSLLLDVGNGFDLKQTRWFSLNDFFFFYLTKTGLVKKAQKVKARRRVERLIADPSDLSLVSLVTQICSFSAVRTTETHTEGERETERKRIHFQGQGLRQTLKLRECAPAVGLGCYS